MSDSKPFSASSIKKEYRVLAKYSIDTGNNLDQIGGEACTHLVSFWTYVSPLFRTVFLEATEYELRRDPQFCALTDDQQWDMLQKRWSDYVSKNQILGTAHAWVLDKNLEQGKEEK